MTVNRCSPSPRCSCITDLDRSAHWDISRYGAGYGLNSQRGRTNRLQSLHRQWKFFESFAASFGPLSS